MELSNFIWHLGAFIFGLWAAILAVSEKRRSKNCIEALLPILFTEGGALSPEQLRSYSARSLEFFESEFRASLNLNCTLEQFPVPDGPLLKEALIELWNLLRSPNAKSEKSEKDKNVSSLSNVNFEFDGKKIPPRTLLETARLQGNGARFFFVRVPADAPEAGGKPFWRVSCTKSKWNFK